MVSRYEMEYTYDDLIHLKIIQLSNVEKDCDIMKNDIC